MPDPSTVMMGPGMAPPRMENTEGGLTVSNVMKEIQVLKDKFKNDDEDHCEYLLCVCVCVCMYGEGARCVFK
jgi:hypothetical protein